VDAVVDAVGVLVEVAVVDAVGLVEDAVAPVEEVARLLGGSPHSITNTRWSSLLVRELQVMPSTLRGKMTSLEF